jgi:mono/diheme cytochrome c family protein
MSSNLRTGEKPAGPTDQGALPARRASPEFAAQIILHGKEGTPRFPSAMPPLGSLSDDQVAAMLTYIRNSWTLRLGGVGARAVATIRKETSGRTGARTDAELQQRSER